MSTSFDEAWRVVAPGVARWCRREMGDDARADELFQRVMIRAWRGHARFRGDCAYETWVTRMAAREAARLHATAARTRTREVALTDASQPAVPPADRAPVAADLGGVVDDALEAGVLRPAEADVVRQRSATPGESWASVAAALGTTPSACAVTHCRAVPKLRTFLCTDRPDLLGGHDALTAAFDRAWSTRPRILGAPEAEVFRAVVLDRQPGYRRRGWLANLRFACAAVVRQLDPTSPG